MNERINELLSGLSPELREKAGNIKTQEELNEFLSENDIELPEDALEAVSGGCGEPKEKVIYANACPDCGADLEFVRYVVQFGGRYRPVARCVKTGIQYIHVLNSWGKR